MVRSRLRHPPSSPSVFGPLGESLEIRACARDFRLRTGHNLPPASPSLSAQALATHFTLHHNAILLGNSLAALAGALWIPWTAQLTIVMWRIEGSSPVWYCPNFGSSDLV